MQTIHSLIATQDAAAPAIGAPGRTPMTFADLRTLSEQTVAVLNGIGIGRGDRVAIVLPNGPEMAAAFIAVGAGASTAPLNPGYRADELEFYLNDLNAKALIVLQGDDTPAAQVAKDHNIPVLVLSSPADGLAGFFTLDTSDGTTGAPVNGGMSEPDDEGLVLHTSGTTSRPKVVPLLNRNLAASAQNIASTLSLTPEDIGLNIMPMFHIHGLVASMLSSMSAGAYVVCTPGFNALKIFQWFKDVAPTWYTAVPTMHQAIMARASRNTEIVEGMRLRFARSSSSSLPPPVMAEVEKTFNCPVIEAYGMTEAAHQMASNPLPPADRKPGSVGRAAGPEVAIIDFNGNPVDQGGEGEICIRGGNVFSGYENNPEANAEAFHGDWFRTGDQGFLDPDGYLTISGRLKEIINRGGEKIAPREVDDVLQAHDAVAQVVTFAMPHEKLGEDVAAIVVLAEGKEATERELRDFAAQKLADFKVPRTILFKDEIPKGATGKLQRIGLAEKLGLA